LPIRPDPVLNPGPENLLRDYSGFADIGFGKTNQILRRHLSGREILLRRHSEGISHAIEESKHGGHVNRLGNLLFLPAGIAKFLHIFRGSAISGLGDLLHIIEQHPLGRGKSRLLELAFDDGLYALIGGSLNTQEVSMAVQSIRAPVQVRDVAGNHFLMPPRKVPLGKMHGVGELQDLAEKIRPRTETLDDAGDLGPTRARAPRVVRRRHVAGGLSIFNDRDLGLRSARERRGIGLFPRLRF
jgi:hypothetical protein